MCGARTHINDKVIYLGLNNIHDNKYILFFILLYILFEILPVIFYNFANNAITSSYNDYYEKDTSLETDQWLQNRQHSQEHQVFHQEK